jgi:hypothetical protein
MKEFDQHKLPDARGDLVVPSKKLGFCLANVEDVPPRFLPRRGRLL